MVFDIETDGINPSKIHCLSYWNGKTVKSLSDYKDIKKWILSQKELIGHNIIRYDIPVLEKLLGIKIKANLIDTLAISWYLYPNKIKHGLESWGEYYGVPKPKITDWENLTLEEYVHRCEEDVKINLNLYKDQKLYLSKLYDDDTKIINYLGFNLTVAKIQENNKFKLDLEYCNKSLEELEVLKKELDVNLIGVMPSIPIIRKYKQPKKLKKDGTLSKSWIKWEERCNDAMLSTDMMHIEVPIGMEPPNPNSSKQVKDWLFSLGWKPAPNEYKDSYSKVTDSYNSVPQIKMNGDIVASLKSMIEDVPEIKHLENHSVISHRIGVLKGFLRDQKNGYLKARIGGFTRTLRMQHRELK